jgi:SAM-dependent methyltransferase
MTTTDTKPIDGARLEAFVGQAVTDMGAAISGLLLHIGDRLGLYKAMAGAGPMTSSKLAARTGTAERYVREWLGNQAAGGYVAYNPVDATFELPAEQAMVVADENSPVFLAGAFETIASCYTDHDTFVDAFRTGAGVGWQAHDDRLFFGVLRLFRPGYAAQLVGEWLPALDGVVDKLRAGASVADIGCGLGASTIIMAEAFERSWFAGIDIHEPSIAAARKAAAAAGVDHRTRFDVASAKELTGTGYDLVCLFDCLHDMGDPIGAARAIRGTLAPDGTLLLVEPLAGDGLEDNLNPVGRIFYGLSTVICTPASLAQEVGLGLGAQAGELRLSGVPRAAASSIASAMPSSSRQMAATRSRSSWASVLPPAAVRARNRSTASPGPPSPASRDSPGTANTHSKGTSNLARLVASMVSRELAASSRSSKGTTPFSRCSQLSSTSSTSRPASQPSTVSSAEHRVFRRAPCLPPSAPGTHRGRARWRSLGRSSMGR